MKLNTDTVQTVTALGSILISFLAFGISVRSCALAERSLDLDQQRFESERLPIWEGTISSDSTLLALAPTQEDINLQRAHVWFPTGINVRMLVAAFPNHDIPLDVLERALASYLEDVTELREGYTTLGVDHALPIVIDSRYVAHGGVYEDQSLYYLEIWYERNASGVEVGFQGLSFGRRLNPSNMLDELEAEWEYQTQ